VYCTKAKQICHWITYFPLEGKDSLISFSAKMTIVKFQQNETMTEDKKNYYYNGSKKQQVIAMQPNGSSHNILIDYYNLIFLNS
jgi:hypothetical protein